MAWQGWDMRKYFKGQAGLLGFIGVYIDKNGE